MNMKRLNVLLIDDEEDYVTTLAERLSFRGIPCRVALSGRQALLTVESLPPDVMVLDFKMPDLDGLAVLKKIKQKHKHIEIVIVSAFLDAQLEEDLKQAGAYACLAKPVDLESLVDLISSAANEKLR